MSPRELPLALFRPPFVLVVEDRPPRRASTGRMASMLGYEVRAARNGEQALGLVRHHPGLFHLVLTNVLLSDMDGAEFVNRVKLEQPGIRAAWMADYAPIGKSAKVIEACPEVPILRTPFGFRELRDALLPLLGPPRAAILLPGTVRSPRRRLRKAMR